MVSDSTPEKSEMAAKTARMLLEIGAVHFQTEAPYTLASGIVSPSYIDCRKVISYPRVRAELMDFMTAAILRDAGFEAFDSVAGGETAGIPFAAWMAERMDLPMQYVRKKPKGYGRDAQIEGVMPEGSRVLLVEDLTTDGGSKISFVDAIRKTGAVCGHTAVIFFYSIFPDTVKNLAANGIELHYLATWHDVLAEAKHGDFFDRKTLDEVERFLAEPLAWSAAHGGIGSVSA